MQTPLTEGRSPAVVRAMLNYSVPMGRRPQIVNGFHERNDLSLTEAQVDIHDATALSSPPSLEREGFVCVSHSSDIARNLDSEEACIAYRRGLGEMMKRLVGADEILMMPASAIRRQDPASQAETAASPPIMFVHSDYTVEGAQQNDRVYQMPDRTPRRTALFNMWQLLSAGPTDTPLAICDARSVAVEDIIAGDSHYAKYGGFSLETAFIRANSAHRWLYFAGLTNNQLLVFKQGDSDSSYPQVVPHSAFDNSATVHGATPRVSIESRCMAIWY